ncbi:MAG: hypothetical protein ACM3S4_04935 [Burkholderiales bacterium]
MRVNFSHFARQATVKNPPTSKKKPLIIQLKQTDPATKSPYPDYTLISSINPDTSVTKYLVNNKLIADAEKAGVALKDNTGRLRDERVLRRDIYREGVKPAIVPEGAKESRAAAKDPDYIKLAFSDYNRRTKAYYVKRDLYEFAKGRGVDLEHNGKPKTGMQIMRELFGVGSDGNFDYDLLAKNLKSDSDKIIDMFGIEDYKVLSAYAPYRAAYEPLKHLGLSLDSSMAALDDLVMNSEAKRALLGDDEYFRRLQNGFDALDEQLKKVADIPRRISESDNAYSASGIIKVLPEYETAFIYADTDEDKIRKYMDIVPEAFDAGNFAAELDLPGHYDMPKEWTSETLAEVINVSLQHKYWKETLGENYEEKWENEMPTMESLIERGHKDAKEKGYEIGDDYAASYGILISGIELMETNENARKQAEEEALAAFGTTEPITVSNDKVSYKYDPVTGFVSDLRIKDSSITGSAGDITEEANNTVGYLLWKKSVGEEPTETEKEFFKQYGMDELITLIDSRGKGDYYKLKDSTKELMKNNLLREANYALYDFTPEELDFLKNASVKTLDMSIQNEYSSKEKDEHWLSALKLYRYYKNDLGMEVTGDYEKDRTAAKKIIIQRLNELGYPSFEAAENEVANSIKAEMYGLLLTDTPNTKKAKEILQNAPPEMFMNTADETEETYKEGAFVAGIRKGGTLGLAELVGETVADPKEYKRMALLGSPIGGTEYYKSGRFYNPAIAYEDARMMQNNPWAFWIGDVLGSLPTTFLAGELAGGIARTLGANAKLASFISGFAPSAIQGGANAAAQGGDAWDIFKGAIVEGAAGGISSGMLSGLAEEGVSKLLTTAPGLIKKVFPAIAGAGADALINTVSSIGTDVILGRNIDWMNALKNILTSLVLKGWHTNDDIDGTHGWNAGDKSFEPGELPDVSKPADIDTKVIDPVSGADITIPKGKSLADVNPEAAKFYDAAITTILGAEDAIAVNDINLPKTGIETSAERAVEAYTPDAIADAVKAVQALPEGTLTNAEYNRVMDSYYRYGLNPSQKNAAAVMELAEQSLGKAESTVRENPDIDIREGAGDNKNDILARNREQGRVFEQQEFSKFSKQNNHAAMQITIKANNTKTRVDAIGINEEGKVIIHEYKSSSTAPLTQNQKTAFSEINKKGGIVVGKGKDIFTKDFEIPIGTEIKVIRPKDKK